ncbi:MAG TPA: hypothetical protein VIO80_06100, partial [Candidatus Dormibacteraeota bacterium]
WFPWMITILSRKRPSLPSGQDRSFTAAEMATARPAIDPTASAIEANPAVRQAHCTGGQERKKGGESDSGRSQGHNRPPRPHVDHRRPTTE